MKSFENDLKKYAEKIHLKVSERRELRERVLSYMEYHPLPKQTHTIEKHAQGILSESFVMFHFNTKYMRIAGGFFALVLIVAPFVAEKSVPGDALYLVKTGFNETIQEQFANSPYKKIEFETKLMERRIAEARVLASEGKLTQEVTTQLAATVKEHTDAVQTGLAELRTQDADGAAIAEIAFNSSLEVQSAVLGANESTNSTSSIDSILTVVNDARDVVVLNQGSVPSFEGLSARVEIETTRAYELLKTIRLTATPEEIVDIERRLSDGDRLLFEAKERYLTEPDRAIEDLAATLKLYQKLIVFMADINIQKTVSLESIVPVVLSYEERVTTVNAEIQKIGEVATTVVQRLELIDDKGVQEKVESGVSRVYELLGQAAAAIEIKEVKNAESSIGEARALVTDLNTMTVFSKESEDNDLIPADGGKDTEEKTSSEQSLINKASSTKSIEPLS
ncbi:MAG: DUF5667 domain-containing protein [Candidatus Pacebacteria bacterium]|nr:DUF5667 domain-containing protein [Candidatus Paceibacterota bacterium]MCF7857373.1 DUF5667 domain-containing protein [Candidatus Paceibacterota bacterium]